MATVAEIKQELDAQGIEYPKNAKKADLEALLNDTENQKVSVVLYKVTVTPDRLSIHLTPDQKEDNVDHVALKGDELSIAEEIGDWLKTTDGLYVLRQYVLEQYDK